MSTAIEDDSQRLFKFVTLYGLKPDEKDSSKLAGTLLHCYPPPTPGNEPHAILSEFCFPDIETRTALYQKELTMDTSTRREPTAHNSTPLTVPSIILSSPSPSLSEGHSTTTTTTSTTTTPGTPHSARSSSSSSSNSNNNSANNTPNTPTITLSNTTTTNTTGNSNNNNNNSNSNSNTRTRRVHRGVYLATSLDKAISPRGSGSRIVSAFSAEADVAAMLLAKRGAQDHLYAYGKQVTLGCSGKRSDSNNAGHHHHSYEQCVCLCVVTRYGWGPVFRVLLGWLAVRLATLGWDGVVELAQAIAAAGMPAPGARLAVTVQEKPLLPSQYTLTRPNDTYKPAAEASGSLLAALGPAGLTDLFAALLFERRIALVCSDFDKLSRCVLAAYDMTWPFTWHYTCITVKK